MRRVKLFLVLVVFNLIFGLMSCTDQNDFVKDFQKIEKQHNVDDGGEGDGGSEIIIGG